MKILVFSDTHGCIETMYALVQSIKPDAVIHLGDCRSDATALKRLCPGLPVESVAGNCDGRTDCPDTIVKSYAGVTLFMTHGHRYGVKNGLLRVCYAAREAQAQVLLFGHTHIPFCDKNEALWILNPGPCQDYGPAGYGVVEVENATVLCYNVNVDRDKI